MSAYVGRYHELMNTSRSHVKTRTNLETVEDSRRIILKQKTCYRTISAIYVITAMSVT